MNRKKITLIAGALMAAGAVFALSGCGSDDDIAYYPVGGTVSGLGNDAVVLQNNGGDDLTVNADGAFTFATTLANGSGYHVTIKTQPGDKVCVADSSAGTVSGPVTSVSVVCEDPASLSGTVEDSNNGAMLGSVTIEARNPADDSVLTSTESQTAINGTLGHFTISVPSSHEFYLHAAGRDIEGTTYKSSNLQTGTANGYNTILTNAGSSTVKFYLTDTATVNSMATNLGFNAATDAVFSMSVEDDAGNGVAGVTITPSPAVTKLEYVQTDGSFSETGPTTAGTADMNGALGWVASPGGNRTYAFSLDQAGTYTIASNFSLRLIPGEISTPLEP